MDEAGDEEPLLLGEDCLVHRPHGVFQVVFWLGFSPRSLSVDTALGSSSLACGSSTVRSSSWTRAPTPAVVRLGLILCTRLSSTSMAPSPRQRHPAPGGAPHHIYLPPPLYTLMITAAAQINQGVALQILARSPVGHEAGRHDLASSLSSYDTRC
jgi:hypothetical protein